MRVTVENFQPPHGAKVNIRIEVTADVRISAETARDIAADFLLMKVGNLLMAGAPDLRVGDRMLWEVPVILGNAARGTLGEVGELLVDAETGEVLFTEEDRRKIKANARAIAERSS
jgi:hypothetical protein